MKQIEYKPESVRLRRRTQAGQSAIVAIITLFLLLFIAAIFISIVAGNLKNTKAAANVSAAGRYAEAGINYLDEQLTNSPEGADWRPVPDCQFGAASCTAVSQNDPDYAYLRPCGVDYNADGVVDGKDEPCGFTRVNFGSDVSGSPVTASQSGGRALVRLTYQPGVIDPRTGSPDPLSRYIKLETVGRVGQILPNDPTTYANTEGLSQRVELVAYKSIGLNEYVRNITNKDNKPGSVGLGAPFPIRDRGLVLSTESLYQGAIHVNAPLTFYGVNRFILNPYRNEALEVSGAIQLNSVSDTTNAIGNGDPTRVYVDVAGLSPNPQPILGSGGPAVFPSNSASFTTLGPELSTLSGGQINGYALVRDNLRGGENGNLPVSTDASGNTYQNLRTVGYVAPPTMDKSIGQNGLTRYRVLTRDSAPLKPTAVPNNPINANVVSSNRAGLYGWGQGLYINNSGDVQSSSSLSGGYSLRGDWLNPAHANYWKGDSVYAPPGVTITLYPRYFTMTRSDNSKQTIFFDTAGQGVPTGTSTVLRYTPIQATGKPTGFVTVPKFEGYPAELDADGIPNSGDENYYSGDYVIYAEGNIRIKGVVGGIDPETLKCFKRHLTVVSNSTIYIDGNLLRDNIPATTTDPTAQQVRGQSTIALLAHDYITVNTTQFFSATTAEGKYQPESDGEQPTLTQILNDDIGLTFTSSGFGPILDPANGFIIPPYLTDTAAGVHSPDLLLRHGSDGVQTSIVAQINSDQYFNFANNSYAATLSTTPVDFDALLNFTNDAFTLPRAALNLGPTLGKPDVLKILRDSTGAYFQTRAAIVPSDIRVEALMYAQEGSFYIIPGAWFNPNRNDTFEQFTRLGYRDGENPAGGRVRTNPLFPFYHEPLDVRITFCGTINENLPAEIGDQGAWMEKWGWVPTNYGSTGLVTATNFPTQGNAIATMHGLNSPYALLRSGNSATNTAASGIIYQFDDRAIAPYAPSFSTQSGRPLRANPYNPNQPLPFAPRLPVAPGLLYYGQNTVR